MSKLNKTINHLPINTQDGYNLWSTYYDQDKNVLVELDPPQFSKRLETILKLKNRNAALDACCGSGRHLPNLEKYFRTVNGADSSSQMLALAANKLEKESSKVFCGNLLDFSPRINFDFINCSLALMHFSELNIFFNKISELLSEEGVIYLTDASKEFLDNGFFPKVECEGSKITIEHFVYNLSDVRKSLEEAGLEVLDFGFIPLNEKLIQKDKYFSKYMGHTPLYYIVARKKAKI
jgi:SAM-dependent methyltransferase